MQRILIAESWDPMAELSLTQATGSDVRCQAANWYAIQTRLRFEKKVDVLLRLRGTETFLPLLNQVRRWSDRSKTLSSPLFPGYVFARFGPSRKELLAVLQTRGVIAIAGPHDQPCPVPDNQIETLRLLLHADVECAMCSFLQTGQRVRIRGGALDGLQGVLQEIGRKSLVVAVDCIQRAISVQIQGYDLEPA